MTVGRISTGTRTPARAVYGEHRHRHYDLTGRRGFVEHQHPVRSERHGHEGLGLVHLAWVAWRWRRLGGIAVSLATVALFVGLTALAVSGWWFFVRDAKWQ